jgi:hypothetical protein
MSKSIFDFFKKEENKIVFAEVKTIDGIVLQYDGELAEGTPLFVLDEEGNQIPAPEGEYQVEYEEQLWVVSIDVNGVLVKLEAVNVEEEPMSEEEPVNEMMSKQEFDAIIQQVITDTDSRITALETKFAELLEVKESQSSKTKEKKLKCQKNLQ